MGRENGKTGRCKSRASQLARFLHREGRKYCAVALCASLIAGSIGNMAIAADESTSNEHEFELSRVALYEALQEAVLEGNTLEKSFTFTGEAADTYDSLLDADGSLYELTPEIEDNDGALQLRIFARLDGEIELESAYDIDGSEEMIFLLTNSSDVEKRAVIHVDDKVTEEIKVAPKSAVLPGDLVNPYKSAAEAAGGPGAAANGETAAADAGEAIVINGGGVSSGGGSGSGGGGGSSSGGKGDVETGGSDVAIIEEIEKETEGMAADQIIEESEANQETEVEESKESEEKKEEPSQGDESGSKVNDSSDSDTDIKIDQDNNSEHNSAGITEDTEVAVEEPEQTDDNVAENVENQGEAGEEDSENENSNDTADQNAAEEADDFVHEEVAEDKLSAAISVHKTYLVTATPSDADEDEATPSDATDSDADHNELDGMVYDAVHFENDSAVAFVTSFVELNLTNLLALDASPSNAGRMHEVNLGDTTVQVWVKNGVLPENAELLVTRLNEDDETSVKYQEAIDALDEAGIEYDDILALDIRFVDENGDEIEPEGNVQVSIRMNKSEMSEEMIMQSVAVHHLAETNEGIKIEKVADSDEGIVEAEGAMLVTEFEVESFSTVTVTSARMRMVTMAEETQTGSMVITKKFVNADGREISPPDDLDHIDLTIQQYFINEANKKVLVGDEQSVTLRKHDGIFQGTLSEVGYYTNFDITSEKMLNLSNELIKNISDWDASGTKFSFDRHYGEAMIEVGDGKQPSQSSNEFEVSGTGFIVINGGDGIGFDEGKATYLIMPSLPSDSSVREDIIKRIQVQVGQSFKLYKNNKVIAVIKTPAEVAANPKIDIRFEENGKAYVTFYDSPNTWTMLNDGDFSFSNVDITGTLTNTLDTNVKTEISVQKKWVGDEFYPRPQEIDVALYNKKDENTPIYRKTLNSECSWKCTFENIDKYEKDTGELIKYTVEELNVPPDYSSSKYESVVDGKLTTIIENKLSPTTLTVSKIVDGNMGTRNGASFEFSLKLIKNGTPYNADLVNYKTDYSKIENGEWKKQPNLSYKNGKYTIYLSHDQSIKIEVPYGYEFDLKEEDYSREGYKTYVQEGKGGESVGMELNGTIIENVEVRYRNYKNVDPPTGIFTHKLPYMLMLAVAVLGMTGFTVADFKRRARRRRNQD